MWHYGHAAEIERRMIVLLERSMEFGEGRGPTAEMVTGGRERLARLYGMPMGLEPVPRLVATIDGVPLRGRPGAFARAVAVRC